MLLFFLCCVEIHQTAVCEDFTLVRRKILEIKVDILDTVSADDLGVNLLLAGKDGLTDARDINEVTCLVIERSFLGDSERNDTPVDTVAAITLGSILIADVRVAAEHLLARSSLLTCRTVTRFVVSDFKIASDTAKYKLKYQLMCLISTTNNILKKLEEI